MTEKLEPYVNNEKVVAYEIGNDYYYYVVSPGQMLANHQHPYTETYWIMEGRGRVDIGGEINEFDGPSIIEVPADVFHVFHSDTEVRFFERRHKDAGVK